MKLVSIGYEARGVVAIGVFSTGVVAIGAIGARGIVAVAPASAGFVSLGVVSVGAIAAAGPFGIGSIGVGPMCISLLGFAPPGLDALVAPGWGVVGWIAYALAAGACHVERPKGPTAPEGFTIGAAHDGAVELHDGKVLQSPAPIADGPIFVRLERKPAASGAGYREAPPLLLAIAQTLPVPAAHGHPFDGLLRALSGTLVGCTLISLAVGLVRCLWWLGALLLG